MTELNWKDHISIDENICQGRACISGTRLPVSVVLDNLAENYSFEDIIQNYPGITREDILSCIKYASLLSHERAVERITTNPQRMGGRPCIRDMRVTAGTLVGLVASGFSFQEIIKKYPYLEEDDIKAALGYATLS